MTEQQAHDELLAAVMAEIEYRNRKFVMSDELDKQLWLMSKWLTGNNSKFGLLLCGDCGNGKSTFLKAFQQLLNYHQFPNRYDNSIYGMRIIDTKDLMLIAKNSREEFHKLVKAPMLGIDDLGTEPAEMMDYGNILTPVVDLISKRNEEQCFTMITTNLQPKQIRERYGNRIADRLNEMVEKIIFENPSYRSVNQ
ncbi:MAG: hypothetical protein HUJ98_03150 [Bacteroidaceae bacterium]|nr:hypothetical protein [Bacteroidaceae bacterium]